MQVTPYLNFKGECEAAFKYYAKVLGAKPVDMFRWAGTPMAGHVPAEWQDKVMHASLDLGGQHLMGADPPPEQYEAPKGFSLSVHPKNTAEAEHLFGELSTGGKVIMPLLETFWAARFGMLVDRFGIPWMFNVDQPKGA
jgi:PhnB protein